MEPLEPGWAIHEERFTPDQPQSESVFTVGNGYLGVRGTPDEGEPAYDGGVVLNSLHDTWPIVYPEDAYGLARTGQTLVSPPDGSIIRLFVDDEPFDCSAARLIGFERTLNMRRGVLTRQVEWVTLRGRRIMLRSSRFASIDDRHLLAIEYELTAVDAPVQIVLSSELVTHAPRSRSADPRRGGAAGESSLVPVAARADECRALLELATTNSGLHVACGMEHAVHSQSAVAARSTASGEHARTELLTELAVGESLRVSKFVAYHWGRSPRNGDLAARVERTLDRAKRQGYEELERVHTAHVARFWRRSDVELEGAPELQLAVRFNLFQLMQATARSEGLGVPAKGVTGRGYEGHYFWDTEIYVVPFLAHTNPDWAKHTLEFRCAMLPAARTRACEVGHQGALYPWRTINGEEASAWYAAGTAQYHINGDIAYAMHLYNRVTGDLAFMLDQGAEVVVETARLWMELGFFSERCGGAFCINSVTGPDEYTTVVDNNAYTNLMAKENLEIAIRVVEWLQASDPLAHVELVAATGVSDDEVDGWRRAAELMYVPRDERLGIVLQDERFLERKRWDFERSSPERQPLLLHHHPLELYRHQVIKQTDVVLATYLLGHHFSAEETKRTFDYYDPLTTGDSSLSACVQSVMASQVGYPDAALAYFERACMVDLLDLQGNTADGIHIASCGGTWLALVAGFGGLRDADGDPCFAPRLPGEWNRLRFRVQVRGQTVDVDMTPEGTTYLLAEGRGLLIEHFGEKLRLEPGCPTARESSSGRLDPVVDEGCEGRLPHADVLQLERASEPVEEVLAAAEQDWRDDDA
jgi:alpha,alpha-trehalose phosphorylase